MIVRDEPILADDYLMYSGYVYVIDGKVGTCDDAKITVKRFKLATGAKEVRRCDYVARRAERECESMNNDLGYDSSNVKAVENKPNASKRVNKYLKKASHF